MHVLQLSKLELLIVEFDESFVFVLLFILIMNSLFVSLKLLLLFKVLLSEASDRLLELIDFSETPLKLLAFNSARDDESIVLLRDGGKRGLEEL
jgi:hypothetical protein